MNNFEWDEQKRIQNLDKHHIDFIDAVHIFYDHGRIENENTRHGECRYQTIGIVNEVVLFVVYTIRNNKIRIISARRASQDERKTYQLSQ